ncbi:MAG: inverse autotransporter beta domain-containing protein [Kiritimatiellae bacterium]|nr:inverse autotransporter beta domain-containing protein [Kiritimatiellia bacterium]
MKRLLMTYVSGCVALFFTLSLPSSAQTHDIESPPTDRQLQTEEARAHTAGRLTLGGRVGESVAEGYLDVLQPLIGWGDGIVFFNPKLSGSDDDEQELSLGIGARSLLPGLHAIAGINVFYDARRTAHDHTFDQIGVGAELLTTWVDARANYYWPDNKHERIDRTSDTTVSQSQSYSLSDIYARRHQFLQNESVVTRTTRTTHYFDRFEEALEGYDAEVGLRLPYLPEWLETRVFAGYYSFEGDYTADINGFRGRLEIRALPALTIDAELYENDKLTGSDYFFGARANLPFDAFELAHGRNPFAGTSDQLKAARRTLRDRLLEMVIRDPHIRLNESGYIEDVPAREVKSDTDTRTKKLLVMDDVSFVNDRNTGMENGTAEHPWSTVQEGVDGSFGQRNVYVWQGAAPYRENVVIAANDVKLRGEGEPIYGYGGRTYGGTRYPLLDGNVGGVNGPSVRVKSNRVLIQGFEIARTPGGADPLFWDDLGFGLPLAQIGILAENAGQLLIRNNRINNQNLGVASLYDPSFPGAPTDLLLHISENNFRDLQTGVWLQGAGSGGRFSATINNNEIGLGTTFGLSANIRADDVSLDILDNRFLHPNTLLTLFFPAIVNSLSTRLIGNTFTQGGDVTLAAPLIAGDAFVDVSDNTFAAGYSYVNVIFSSVGGESVARMNRNVMDTGFLQTAVYDTGGGSTMEAIGNTLRNAPTTGITLTGGNSGGPLTVTANDNTIINAAGIGISVAQLGVASNNLLVSLRGNTVENAAGHGIIAMFGSVEGDATWVIENNTLVNNGGAGLVALTGVTMGDLTVNADANQATGNGGPGFQIDAPLVGGDASIAIRNSQFDGNGGHGLSVNVSAIGTLDLLIDPTTANNNAGPGMAITTLSGGSTLLTMEDVTASGNGGPGMIISAVSTQASVQAGFMNVAANSNASPGMIVSLNAVEDIFVAGAGGMGFVPNGIQANNNLGPGLILNAMSSSGSVAFIASSLEANGNQAPGLLVDLLAQESAAAILGTVTADNNFGPGVILTAQSASDEAAVIAGSLQATNNMGGGASFVMQGALGSTAMLGTDFLALGDDFAGGPVNTSDNTGNGLSINATSSSGAVSVLVGELTASRNTGNGATTFFAAQDDATVMLGLDPSGGMPLILDVEANDNGGGGIMLSGSSQAGDVLGLVLGGEASGNASLGLFMSGTANQGDAVLMVGTGSSNGTFSAQGNGAGGMIAILNATNGSASAQLIAGNLSNNGGNGGQFVAIAKDGASVVFGDSYYMGGDAPTTVIATNNAGIGLYVMANSQNGTALLLTEALQISDNLGGGLLATVIGQDDVVVALGLDPSPGGGVTAAPVELNRNGGIGASITAISSEGASSVLIPQFEANENVSHGLTFLISAQEDATLELGGSAGLQFTNIIAGSGVANANQDSGIMATLTSTSNSATVALGTIEASGNTLMGLELTTTAIEGEASILSGTIASDPLASITANTNGTSGVALSLAGELTTAAIENLQANNNGEFGVAAQLNATTEAHVMLGLGSSLTNVFPGVLQANGNATNGVFIAANAPVGLSSVRVGSFQANANGGNGVSILSFASDFSLALGRGIAPDAVSATGEASGNQQNGVSILALATNNFTATIADVTASTNAGNGMSMDILGNNMSAHGEGNQFRQNSGDGLYITALAFAPMVFDFGGIASPGQNSFTGNGGYGLNGFGVFTLVSAEQNWWGSASPVLGVDYSVNVNAGSPLAADPNP